MIARSNKITCVKLLLFDISFLSTFKKSVFAWLYFESRILCLHNLLARARNLGLPGLLGCRSPGKRIKIKFVKNVRLKLNFVFGAREIWKSWSNYQEETEFSRVKLYLQNRKDVSKICPSSKFLKKKRQNFPGSFTSKGIGWQLLHISMFRNDKSV